MSQKAYGDFVGFILVGIGAITTIYWVKVIKKMTKNVTVGNKFTTRETEAKNWVYDLIKGDNQFVFVSEVPGPDDGLTIFADYIPVVHVVMLATGISLVFIIGWELLWFLTKRKTHRELLQIHSSFIHRSYVTMFEFVRPEGETKVDKLFNHLSLVFPEVEKFKERLDKKQKKFSEREESLLYPKTETTDTYDFITATGTFLLIIFKTTVKWEDVEKMIKVNNRDQNVEKLFGSDIMRIIYLADKYDPFFETDDFISKMKETKRKFKLDLIKEDNLGYSTIWIDR